MLKYQQPVQPKRLHTQSKSLETSNRAPRGSIPDICVDARSSPSGISSPEEGVVFAVILFPQDTLGRRVSTIWPWETD
jgi:hypothetical protein